MCQRLRVGWNLAPLSQARLEGLEGGRVRQDGLILVTREEGNVDKRLSILFLEGRVMDTRVADLVEFPVDGANQFLFSATRSRLTL